jgi:hypothetical protein
MHPARGATVRTLPVALILPVLVSAGPSPGPVATPQGCPITITEKNELPRGLPELFYDQGRTSIYAINAHPQILAARRTGRIGKVTYSILVYQPAPNAPVSVDAVAVDFTARRGWDVRSSCDVGAWTEGLFDAMEALARLPDVAR